MSEDRTDIRVDYDANGDFSISRLTPELYAEFWARYHAFDKLQARITELTQQLAAAKSTLDTAIEGTLELSRNYKTELAAAQKDTTALRTELKEWQRDEQKAVTLANKYAEQIDKLHETIEKINASVQTCSEGHKYFAKSHEYPCPYCSNDLQAENTKLKAALVWIAQQPCRGDEPDMPCTEQGICITEYCLPCFATQALAEPKCGTCGNEFGGFMDYEQTEPCPDCPKKEVTE